MTKKLIIVLAVFAVAIGVASCGTDTVSQKSSDTTDINSDYSGSYGSNYNSDSYSDNKSGYNDSDYDYNKGYGYTSPKEGKSLSDYIKREDPDLYNDMKNRYDNSK